VFIVDIEKKQKKKKNIKINNNKIKENFYLKKIVTYNFQEQKMN